MKQKYLVPVVFAGSFLGTAAFADWKQVTTEEGYISAFVGKNTVDADGNTYRHSADGTFTGKLKSGDKLRGAWQWRGKYWCRNAIIGDRELGTDCQKVEVDGNKWRITRERGKGRSVFGTMK